MEAARYRKSLSTAKRACYFSLARLKTWHGAYTDYWMTLNSPEDGPCRIRPPSRAVFDHCECARDTRSISPPLASLAATLKSTRIGEWALRRPECSNISYVTTVNIFHADFERLAMRAARGVGKLRQSRGAAGSFFPAYSGQTPAIPWPGCSVRCYAIRGLPIMNISSGVHQIRIQAAFALGAMILLYSASSAAKTLYVDANAGSDSTTYASNGPTSPWASIGRAPRGEVQVERPRTQVKPTGWRHRHRASSTYTTAGTDARYLPAYNPVNSGSAGNPITFEADGAVTLRYSSGTGPVIGAYERNYITWRGFRVDER